MIFVTDIINTHEMEMLKAEANAMQASLAAVQKRITELENDSQQ